MHSRIFMLLLGILVVVATNSCGGASYEEDSTNEQLSIATASLEHLAPVAPKADSHAYMVFTGSAYFYHYTAWLGLASRVFRWSMKTSLRFASATLSNVVPETDSLADYTEYNYSCYQYPVYIDLPLIGIRSSSNHFTSDSADLSAMQIISSRKKGRFKMYFAQNPNSEKMVVIGGCRQIKMLKADVVAPQGSFFQKLDDNTYRTTLKLENIRLEANPIDSAILDGLGQSGAYAEAQITFRKSLTNWWYNKYTVSVKIIPYVPDTPPEIEIQSPPNPSRVEPLDNCSVQTVSVRGTVSHTFRSPSEFSVRLTVSSDDSYSEEVAVASDGTFEADVPIRNGAQTISASVVDYPEVLDSVVVVMGQDSPPAGHPANGHRRSESVSEFGLITPTGGRLGDHDLEQVLQTLYPDAVEWVGTEAFVVGGHPGTTTRLRIQWVSEQAGYRSDVGMFIMDPKHPPSSIDDILDTMDSSSLFVLFNSGSYGRCCRNNIFEPIDDTTQFYVDIPAGSVFGFILFPNGTLAQAKRGHGKKPHTTIAKLNPDGNVHTLVFESENGRVVDGEPEGIRQFIVAFEDIAITKRSRSDQDFSDIVLSVTLDAQPAPIFDQTSCQTQSNTNRIYVSGGNVWIGCDPSTYSECFTDEQPYHQVELSSFYIDKHEVTVDEFAECVEAGKCSLDNIRTFDDLGSCNYGRSGFGNHPLNCVNWFAAEEYCEWKGGRLPTEAEWELAARGTDGRLYPWGNDPPDCDKAVIDDGVGNMGCGQFSTAEVCTHPAGNSPYGLCDMTGNVAEWTLDWYDAEYYRQSDGAKDPRGPAHGEKRTLRGGSWMLGIERQLRASVRWQGDPRAFEDVLMTFGFRCVYKSAE